MRIYSSASIAESSLLVAGRICRTKVYLLTVCLAVFVFYRAEQRKIMKKKSKKVKGGKDKKFISNPFLSDELKKKIIDWEKSQSKQHSQRCVGQLILVHHLTPHDLKYKLKTVPYIQKLLELFGCLRYGIYQQLRFLFSHYEYSQYYKPICLVMGQSPVIALIF